MAIIVEYYEVIYDFGFEIDSSYVCARFTTLSAAQEYAKFDRFRYVSKLKKKIIVYDNVKELEIQAREDLRNAALAKLTNEERLVLGI